MTFHDHFSEGSAAYREARPTYPRQLFEWLATASPATTRAWDCACGNGQATVPLAEFFDEVVGTDASEKQLAEAEQGSRVVYRRATAEASGLDAASVDLVTCAQAAHWFDHAAFHREVRRVLCPGGLLAVWTYGVHSVSPEVDRVVGRYYTEIVGPFWPPERTHVDEHYVNLPFPFARISTPAFEMSHSWDLGQLVAYLETWSATREFKRSSGRDPLEIIGSELASAWGDPTDRRTMKWPLTLLAGYCGESAGS